MADEKTITYGLAVMFVILAAGITGTTTYVLTQENIDKGYICSVDTRYQMGDRLSGTGATLYWTVNGTQKQSLCKGGTWIPITTYARDNGIDINDLLNKPQDANDEDQNQAIEIIDEPVKESSTHIFYEPTSNIKVWVSKDVYAECLKQLSVPECNDKLLLNQLVLEPVVEEQKLTKEQIIEIKTELNKLTAEDIINLRVK